jgi:hypothetical protein
MDEQGEFGSILDTLGRHGIRVEAMDSARERDLLGYRLELEVPPAARLEAAIGEIRRMPAVHQVDVRGAGNPTQAGRALEN